MGAKVSRAPAAPAVQLDMEAVARAMEGEQKRLPYRRVKALAEQSRFSTAEVRELFLVFRRHAAQQGMPGTLGSPQALGEALREAGLQERLLRDDSFVGSLFEAFDRRQNRQIDFTEFILGLSTASRGSLDEKLRLSFDAYDLDGTGRIHRSELVHLLSQLDRHAYRMAAAGGAPDEGKSEPGAADASAVEAFVDDIFRRFDTDRTGSLTYEQFRDAVVENPALAGLKPAEVDASLASGGEEARLEWERQGLERGWLQRSADGVLRLTHV